MAENENAEDIRAEVPKDSSNAVTSEPADSASNDVPDVPAVDDASESAASVVDEAKSAVSNRENSESRLDSDARPASSRYMSDLMKASNLHCPFVWRKDLDTSTYLDHELDLLSSAEEMFDDLGFRFRRYIISLVMCYHNFYKRNIQDCMDYLDALETMMKQSSRKDSNDYLFNTINDALYHVIHSCRIYIFDTTDQKDRSKQILNKIKSYESMNDANKAGLWAIRANVYVEYGYEGVKNAVAYMRKAVDIDPKNAFWHFMKGMFIGRLRRMEGGLFMPENEEFQALRTAMELREDPAFIAFTGETYLETAKTAKRLHVRKKTDKDSEKQVASLLQDLNEVAAKYFKTSIKLKPSSSHLLFRCGKGLMNLPPPHQDIKMGLDFIRKGLEIAPDSGYGNHAMAMFLDKIEKNPTLAKEFLGISIEKKNFPAHLDMIRIEFQESRNKQKLWSELETMLKLYKEMPRRRKILGEMVCYHLFIDYNLVEACFFMKSLIQSNSTSIDVINSHKTMILPVVAPIPLSDLIFNRIEASLKDRKLRDDSKQVFAKYIQFLIDENVEPQRIDDEFFAKIKRQIELGFKNKQPKQTDEHDNVQKRVRGAHEFEANPCAEEELGYSEFYKNDLNDTNVGKTRGVGDDMMNLLHRMGENPLPKRRFDRDMTEGDRRRLEDEGSGRRHSRSSRNRHRRRSYSSSTDRSSSSGSSDRRSSRKYRQSSRSRRRSSSSASSYSSSSSGSSDRYSKSSRRRKNHRRRSSSHDSKRSHGRQDRRRASPDAKSRRQKRSKHVRSSSSSYSSSFSSYSSASESCRSNSASSRPSKKETDSNKIVDEPKIVDVVTEAGHPGEQIPKTNNETSVDHRQALNTLDLIRSDSATPNKIKQSEEGGKKDRNRKHSIENGCRRKDASDSEVHSSSSRRSHSTKNREAKPRSPLKESKHLKDDRSRRSRQEEDGRDRRSKTVSSQSSD